MSEQRRNKHPAKRFFKTLLKGWRDAPRVAVTDQGQRYGAALKEILQRQASSA